MVAVLLGVSLLMGVASTLETGEKADATPVEAKVEAEEPDLQAQESRRVETKVHLQSPIKGQLSTAQTPKDSSFYIDSRADVTSLQGAVPKDNILHNHEKFAQNFQNAAQKAHMAYITGVESNLVSVPLLLHFTLEIHSTI